MTRWINTPCTDPVGRVFLEEERVFRAIFPDQEKMVRSILGRREVATLMEDGLVARMAISSRRLDGYGLVIEAERAPFDIPCERFTRATLRAAALRWLEIYRRLLPGGLFLLDAHFGNFMLYGASEPRWVDLGSILPPVFGEEEKPFRSFARFWDGMLAPLALLETQPQHARLARLAMSDQAYQGPRTTVDESPLQAGAPVEALHRQIHADVAGLDASRALEKLAAFVQQLPARDETGEQAESVAATIVQRAREQLAAVGAKSVTCLGADACRRFAGAWGRADVLVIDEREDALDRLRQDAAWPHGGGQLALCYGHPVNRLFLKSAPVNDAVIAIDPLTRLAHDSRAELDNLAHIVGSLGQRLAVVLAAPRTQARTEQMLRQAYPTVDSEKASWFGTGPVLIIGRK